MILFFAIAAAICLQGFTKANQISQSQAAKDQAVIVAQNAAEVLKNTHGDLDAAADLLHGQSSHDTVTVFYDVQWQYTAQPADAAFQLQIRRIPSDTPLLGSADISVLSGQDILFELSVSWQEVQ